MKNKNKFFLGLVASIIFAVSSLMLLFSDFLITGSILFIFGFFVATISLSKIFSRSFEDSFLFVASVLSLVILVYIFFIEYSKNVIIISTSFYALNFLIQINSVERKKRHNRKKIIKRETTVKTTNKTNDTTNKTNDELIKPVSKIIKTKNPESVKVALVEEKKEILSNKSDKVKYYFVEGGSSFHLPGCIALARSDKRKLKGSHSRDDLIRKGYKTCKLCNS
ncbi:MAG: hypothetical protein ACOC1P_04500 [Minisyncoccales bacterium]